MTIESESFDKAVEAAAEAMSGWRFIEHEPGCGEHTELSEPARAHYARAAVLAALPHLTAQDVPHVAREAWDEGYDRALRSHCDALDLDGRCDVEDTNPYAEEADHE